jgi:large subunit ribosomal protein L13
MAEMISVYIRGKHKPTYDPKYSGADGDMCVVVNASKPLTTGNKGNLKVYRRYTGYVGNMKETSMKHQLERKPDEVLLQAVRGMMPKNKLKNKIIMEKLMIYPGPYHDVMPTRLPQFTTRDLKDINEHFHFGEKLLEHKDEYKIVYASDPNALPEELANLDIEYDEDLTIPQNLAPKTHTNPKSNTLLQSALNKRTKHVLKRYKRYKNHY